MNPLIWMCLAACLASVSGIFLDPPARRKTTARKQDSDDDDFMGGLKQFFGYTPADTNTSSHNKTAQESAESSGIYEELDTALEHATDSMDGLWQQFKKGLFSLIGSFSAGDDDDDGHSSPSTAVSVAPVPGLQQTKPIVSQPSAVSEPTLPSPGATTTVRIITATTTEASTTTQASTTIPTTTPGTASAVETTTIVNTESSTTSSSSTLASW